MDGVSSSLHTGNAKASLGYDRFGSEAEIQTEALPILCVGRALLQLRQDLFAHLGVRIDVLNVIEVFQRFD